MSNVRSLRMSLISYALVLISLLPLAPNWIDRAEAHWLGTHEKMIAHALDILATSPPQGNSWTEFVALLQEHERYLIEGVRDADLRANGIYAIDCGCEDPKEGWEGCSDGKCPPKNLGPEAECCPESKLRCNEIADISQFIVGDHGYNPRTGEGGYVSDSEACIRVNEILEGYEKNPHPCESRAAGLWKKLAGEDADVGANGTFLNSLTCYATAMNTWQKES